MCAARTLDPLLAELRRLARRRKNTATPDCAQQLLRALSQCELRGIEERANGVAFRFTAGEPAAAVVTCFLHHPADTWKLTTAEADVAAELCAGRTLAQIGRLRGVSTNTIKSQVRQIFRKLEVDSRVALARRLF